SPARVARSSSNSTVRSASSTRIPRRSTMGTRTCTVAGRACSARCIRSALLLRKPACRTLRAMGTRSCTGTLLRSAPIWTVALPPQVIDQLAARSGPRLLLQLAQALALALHRGALTSKVLPRGFQLPPQPRRLRALLLQPLHCLGNHGGAAPQDLPRAGADVL